jgi:hypothetical protein
MGENAEVTFALTGLIGLATQGRAEESLVPREGALGLPALAVDAPVPAALWLPAAAFDHLPTVARQRPLPALVAAVQRDHGGADAQLFAAVAVALLAVERGIAEHPVVAHSQRRLGHHRAQLRRVVGRPQADGGAGQEVAGGVAGDRQLGPQPGVVLTAGALEEVARGVPALQPGGIDGRGRLLADQAALFGARAGPVQEQDELPFFSSLLAA